MLMVAVRLRIIVLAATCMWLTVADSHAQFVTTINAPPEVVPAVVPSDTRLNVFDGAPLSYIAAGQNTGASTNVEVNISGSTVGNLDANRGSTVNISGGYFLDGPNIASGSTVNISGGAMGDRIDSLSGSQVRLLGGSFRLDGVLVPGLGTVGNSARIGLADGAVLSGTLADGTPFAFSSFSYDDFDGVLTLVASELPAIGPALITAPGQSVPLGIRSGQTLVVAPDGAVSDNFNAGFGSSIQINGGTIGDNLEAVGASIEISAGSLGDRFDAYAGSDVIISGGSVGTEFQATKGSTVTISGGTVDYGFAARTGSVVNLLGGSLRSLLTQSGSEISISGGVIGRGLRIESGSQATILGYDYRLNGQPIAGLGAVGSTKAVNVPYNAVLSGILADGTPFVLTGIAQDSISDGTLTLRATLPLPNTPTLFQVPTDPAPQGIRAHQTLVLANGGSLPNDFTAGRGSKLQINGGTVGDGMEVEAAEVNIVGGTVGDGFRAYNGSVINISGGLLDQGLSVDSSTVNVSGTAAVPGLGVGTSGRANISGGGVGALYVENASSSVNVSGGTVDNIYLYSGVASITGGSVHDLFVNGDGKVDISGGDFRLDGVPIAGLDAIGNSVIQDVDRRSVLTGVLTDGTPFAYFSEFSGPFQNGALKLTATAVPSAGPPDVTLPGPIVPTGLRNGRTLLVNEGGDAGDHFTAIGGSTLTVAGGRVGDRLKAVDSHVTVVDGSIGDIFYATSGAKVDLRGGKIGNNFRGMIGSEIDISGGTTGIQFWLYHGSKLTMSGGSMGDLFRSDPGSSVRLVGGEFLLNGQPIPGLDAEGSFKTFDLPEDSVLTGTFADGTPFVFSSLDGDQFAQGTLTLQTANLPVVGPSSIVLPDDPAPLGIRSGQMLVLNGGNLPENFSAGPGSHVIINDGQVGRNFEAIGAQVDIAGGTVDESLDAFAGSTINISGGEIGNFVSAYAGSRVNISGGRVGHSLGVLAGGNVNVSGGSVAEVRLQGGELAVSGEASIEDLTGSGTAHISGGRIQRFVGSGLLNISGGTFGGTFQVYKNTTVNMSGGEVTHNINLFSEGGIVFNLTGGSLGDRGIAHSGKINISGGSLGASFQAYGAVEVNISGGAVGDHFIAFSPSTINVSGGQIGQGFDALSGSDVNISGGEFGPGFNAQNRSNINIFGREFALDGASLDSALQYNVPFTISSRNVRLSGILLDGTPFSFDLNSNRVVGEDFFDPGAFLKVIYVPEPATLQFLALTCLLVTRRTRIAPVSRNLSAPAENRH